MAPFAALVPARPECSLAKQQQRWWAFEWWLRWLLWRRKLARRVKEALALIHGTGSSTDAEGGCEVAAGVGGTAPDEQNQATGALSSTADPEEDEALGRHTASGDTDGSSEDSDSGTDCGQVIGSHSAASGQNVGQGRRWRSAASCNKAVQPVSDAAADDDTPGLGAAGAAVQAVIGDTEEEFAEAALLVASFPEGALQAILTAGGEAVTAAQENGLSRNAAIRAGELCARRLCRQVGLGSEQADFVAKLYLTAFAWQDVGANYVYSSA